LSEILFCKTYILRNIQGSIFLDNLYNKYLWPSHNLFIASLKAYLLYVWPQKYATWYRIGGLTLASLMCTTAASRLAVTGGGYLATIILSSIAVHGWRILTISYDVSNSKYVAQWSEI